VKTSAVEPKREATVSSELQKCKSRRSQRSQRKFGEVGAVTHVSLAYHGKLRCPETTAMPAQMMFLKALLMGFPYTK
jgi:hypothetical protein